MRDNSNYQQFRQKLYSNKFKVFKKLSEHHCCASVSLTIPIWMFHYILCMAWLHSLTLTPFEMCVSKLC